MRLFSDEWNRREWDTSSRSQHRLLLYLFYQVEIRSRRQCDALERDFQNRSRIFHVIYVYHNMCYFVNNCLAATPGQSVPASRAAR